jgi:hypothetical protein
MKSGLQGDMMAQLSQSSSQRKCFGGTVKVTAGRAVLCPLYVCQPTRSVSHDGVHVATNNSVSATDPIGSDGQRFYRVRLVS